MYTSVIRDHFAAVLRISLGWVFFWAFLDKFLGLGYATPRARAWVNGGSPTQGFLGNVEGPFEWLFSPMAGNVAIDAIFMLGLLGIGLAFLFGIGMHIAGWSGAVMLTLMWLAVLPLTNNPFMDDHLIYAVAMLLLVFMHSGRTWGFGDWWSKHHVVQRYRWLE